MKKDVVFIPIKTKYRQPKESGYYHTKAGMYYFDKKDQLWYSTDDKRYIADIKVWLEPRLSFVFTEEELNEYTSNVIKQTLETAAENAELKEQEQGDWDVCWVSNDMGEAYVLAKESITNTFEEIFKKFKIVT